MMKLQGNETCNDIVFSSAEPLRFSQSELELLCDNKGPSAWQNIPVFQKKFFLKRFLAARAYYFPQFIQEKNTLLVEVGPRAYFYYPKVSDRAKRFFDIWKSRNLFGRPLNSSTLDQLEDRIKYLLADQGFPCPNIVISADPKKHEVNIDFETGKKHKFGFVKSLVDDPQTDLTTRRYFAFKESDTFTLTKLALTKKRISRQETLVDTHFSTVCKPNGEFYINQTFVKNKPHLISMGFGIDSEEFVFTNLLWKNVDFYENGSKLLFNLDLSFYSQTASVLNEWYYVDLPLNHFLKSTFKIQRFNRTNFDSRNYSINTGPFWKIDFSSSSHEYWFQLITEHNELVRGEGLPTSEFSGVGFHWRWQDHVFELQQPKIEDGWSLNLDYLSFDKLLGSSFSFNSATLENIFAHNVYGLTPALWILTFRTIASSIWGISKKDREVFPSNYLFYLGGNDSLRGFGRNKIPQTGAFTSFSTNLELKAANLFPFGLSPLVFVDAGKVGQYSFQFDDPTYYSPGFGVGWDSPFGLMKSTLAHGLVAGNKSVKQNLRHLERWQFYFSIGGSF